MDQRRGTVKKCANKNCGKSFYPSKTTQRVCSYPCALEFAKQKNYEKEVKKAKARKRQHKIEEMTKDKYRAVKIQPLINKIARLIDYGQVCIASRVDKGKMAGGHYHAVGHNRTLSLNLHNIHIQSYHSNGPQGGQHIKYRHGLIEEYGNEYTDFIDMHLCQCPSNLWTKNDLMKLRPGLLGTIKQLEADQTKRTPLERITLRNQINEQIKLYPKEFSIFSVE